MNYKSIILKLSGEALMDKDRIFKQSTLVDLYEQVKGLKDKGVQVAIVVGGGNIFRGEMAEGATARVPGPPNPGPPPRRDCALSRHCRLSSLLSSSSDGIFAFPARRRPISDSSTSSSSSLSDSSFPDTIGLATSPLGFSPSIAMRASAMLGSARERA